MPVLARLGLPASVSHAAVHAHRPEELRGAAAVPLAEGEVGAAVVGTKVGGDQDALKPDQSKAILILGLVGFCSAGYHTIGWWRPPPPLGRGPRAFR